MSFTIKAIGKEKTYEEKLPLLDVEKDFGIEEERYIAAKVNNRVRDLNYEVYYDAEVEFLDVKDHEAMMEMRESFTEFMQEHKTLMLAVKNINRATILDMCERATRRGFISDNNFKCLCELEESYHRLHGNSYTDEIIEKTKLMYKNQTIHSIEQLPPSVD